MATKNITGSYPSGYALDPAFQTLNISSAATVGGAGVTTTASQPSTINNLGKVQGTANGVTLSDGGVTTNGSASNTAALIEGTTAIAANNAPATVKNSAQIKSDVVVSGYNSTTAVSVALNQGGAVTNSATGQITNGVLIATTPGTVTNDGTVGGSISTYRAPRRKGLSVTRWPWNPTFRDFGAAWSAPSVPFGPLDAPVGA